MVEKKPVIISACLAGHPCRYDGGDKGCSYFIEKVICGEAIFLCPEQLGGLPTPREKAEIINGDGFDVMSGRARVMDSEGLDVTEQFLKGAGEVFKLARDLGASEVLLCEGSPSCGVKYIYRDGKKIQGQVFAQPCFPVPGSR